MIKNKLLHPSGLCFSFVACDPSTDEQIFFLMKILGGLGLTERRSDFGQDLDHIPNRKNPEFKKALFLKYIFNDFVFLLDITPKVISGSLCGPGQRKR